MAEVQSVKNRIHFVPETVFNTLPGGGVTRRMRSARINPTSTVDKKEVRIAGNKLAQHYLHMREYSESGLEDGIPTYNEMGYFAASAIAIPQSSGTGTAGQYNRHEFWFDNQGDTTPRSYSFEFGYKEGRVKRITGAVFTEFGIEIGNGENATAEMTGALIASAIDDGVTPGGGTNAVWTITIDATSGSWRYRYKGKTSTLAIAYNANAAAVQAQVDTVHGAGQVVVAGNGPYVLTASGSNFDDGRRPPRPEVFSDRTSPLAGNTATAEIVTTTEGGVIEEDIVEIMPGHVTVYMADAYEDLYEEASRLTRGHVAGFAITDRWGPYFTLDGEGADSFTDVVELPVSARFNLQLQANSSGMALLGTSRTDSQKWIAVVADGPLIAGSDNHKMILEAAVKVAAVGTYEDDQGVYQANYELASVEDEVDGTGISFRMILENGKIGYAA